MVIYLTDFAFVGRMGSGKSTAADYLLAHDDNRTKVPMAKCLRDTYNILWPGEGFNRWRMQELGRLLRQIDPDTLVNYALREMERLDFNLGGTVDFVVDDVRYPNEWYKLKEEGFVTVRVVADRSIRLDRLRRNGKLQDESELEHETENSLPENEYVADYTIVNENSLEHLNEDVLNIAYREWRKS